MSNNPKISLYARSRLAVQLQTENVGSTPCMSEMQAKILQSFCRAFSQQELGFDVVSHFDKERKMFYVAVY